MFDNHLSAQQNSETDAQTILHTPIESYEKLNQVKREQSKAFSQIPVFDNDNILFFLAPLILGGHYYLWNKWLFHNDWWGLVLLGTLLIIPSFILYVPCALGIGTFINKFRLTLWKSRKANQPLLDNYQRLVHQVEELTQAHHAVCKTHLSEKMYFQYMFNFDQIVQRITHHPVYTPAFYQHTLYTNQINLPEMRESLKQAYLERSENSTKFFHLYYQALQLEEVAARAWVQFEAQDSEILEEKYQVFARTQTDQLELQDII